MKGDEILFDFAVVVDTGCGRNNGHCCDCNIDTIESREFYMVQHEVWKQAEAGQINFLCVGCLEHRLGRSLVPADFMLDVPLNKSAGKSDRLKSRLGRGGDGRPPAA
jgi:hypothetical protein